MGFRRFLRLSGETESGSRFSPSATREDGVSENAIGMESLTRCDICKNERLDQRGVGAKLALEGSASIGTEACRAAFGEGNGFVIYRRDNLRSE